MEAKRIIMGDEPPARKKSQHAPWVRLSLRSVRVVGLPDQLPADPQPLYSHPTKVCW